MSQNPTLPCSLIDPDDLENNTSGNPTLHDVTGCAPASPLRAEKRCRRDDHGRVWARSA